MKRIEYYDLHKGLCTIECPKFEKFDRYNPNSKNYIGKGFPICCKIEPLFLKHKTMSKKTLFLGGTCNNSQWREQLIPLLNSNIDAFNPVVPDWTLERQEIEKEKRKTSDVILYFITPMMTGVFAIAEAVQDSNIRPEKTIFAYVPFDGEFGFNTHQMKSLEATLSMIESNGAKVARSIEEVAELINNL